MELGLFFWEGASRSGTQGFPYISWNPKDYSMSSPPLVPILRHISQVHTTQSHSFKTHFNIIMPPMSRLSYLSLSFWFSQQNSLCVPLITYECYMPCPCHPPWLDHSNYIWHRVIFAMLLIVQLPPKSCYFIPFRSKHSPQYPVHN
jgi:hypothetical protein